MTKPADQERASPPSSVSAYVFEGPAQVAIRTRTSDQPRYVDTRLNVWTWYDGGKAMKIDWPALKLNPNLVQIAKAFVAYALEKYAPVTAFKASGVFGRLSESEISTKFPWSRQEVITTISTWAKFRESTIFFRTFYRWALNRGIMGFEKETYLALKEIKTSRLDPYGRIFLSQSGLALDEEIRLLQRIDRDIQTEGWNEIQSNIMLHISFELGPRSIQFHSLEIADFEFIESADHERYYTLWLPMAKKVGERTPERRPRKITTRLGEKIEQHVGVYKSNQVTMLLRHHLGQGLADQGTPADMIAELLGHNSTVAARAYVTATPNIARIKEKALGKSPSYQRLMRSLLTGEIVQRRNTQPERSIRSVINTQYIGDIGACALPVHTHCPYNPVYACYTCKKFHPFADGRHEQVKHALQREAQQFIDMAEHIGDLTHNRPISQHQITILAVDATIERCRQFMEDAADDVL